MWANEPEMAKRWTLEETNPVEESSSPIEEIQEMAEESIPAEQTIIDEVSPNTSSHLPENIEKLVEFMKETGGTVQDYVRLNADYSDVERRCFTKRIL